MDRVILHCDMNGFFASVELLSHPELRNIPMAVCGTPENRHGIILAKNDPAKKYGVVTAETIWQAQKKCPDLQLVRPHMEKYHYYSKLINDIYYQYTDLVEPFSIDESWLDVTGSRKLFGSGIEIADAIRKTVREKYNLTLSAGVSFNKIFAKMGSEYKKPDATTEITRNNFKELLWPLPVKDMFFVGRATADKLYRSNITTIGSLARTDKMFLNALLGKMGATLYDYANGFDTAPVCRESERKKIKSVGNGITFKRNLETYDDILIASRALADTVSGRLRRFQIKAHGVKVDIKDPYFKVISRQKQLDIPTNLGKDISDIALSIIQASWPTGSPIRLLTITAINLCDENEAQQLSLFSLEGLSTDSPVMRETGENLERTMDAIRNRYGASSITFGGIINNDIGIDWEYTSEEEYTFEE